MENEIEEMPVEVKALEDFLLYIKFQNGEEKIYDMKDMLMCFFLLLYFNNI